MRTVFTYLKEHLGEDVTTANLVISGTGSVLVRTGEELIDALRSGQGVLNVLQLGGVKDELDASIVDLTEPRHARGHLRRRPARRLKPTGCVHRRRVRLRPHRAGASKVGP